jgi:hypothetical protein
MPEAAEGDAQHEVGEKRALVERLVLLGHVRVASVGQHLVREPALRDAERHVRAHAVADLLKSAGMREPATGGIAIGSATPAAAAPPSSAPFCIAVSVSRPCSMPSIEPPTVFETSTAPGPPTTACEPMSKSACSIWPATPVSRGFGVKRRAMRSPIMFSNHQSRVLVPNAWSIACGIAESARFVTRTGSTTRPFAAPLIGAVTAPSKNPAGAFRSTGVPAFQLRSLLDREEVEGAHCGTNRFARSAGDWYEVGSSGTSITTLPFGPVRYSVPCRTR